ncbi:MAG TPA: hypothetical protein VKF14_15565 [Candidatus Dormibacteraeota bacterium]|nr:hypothetical protein [Candidatus Dormibacteraeota bacterium]
MRLDDSAPRRQEDREQLAAMLRAAAEIEPVPLQPEITAHERHGDGGPFRRGPRRIAAPT